MHTRTKAFALLLTVCLLVSSLPLTAAARDGAFKDGLETAACKGIEVLINGLVGAVERLLPVLIKALGVLSFPNAPTG